MMLPPKRAAVGTRTKVEASQVAIDLSNSFLYSLLMIFWNRFDES